jgi:hypothetical protein
LTLEKAREVMPSLARAELMPDTGCWVWRGWTAVEGYGLIDLKDRRSVRVHRYTFETLRSPIAPGLVLDHLCRNRACVNPWHLEPITPAENTRRGARASGMCRNGLHPMQGENVIVRYRDGLPRYECKACKDARTERADETRQPQLSLVERLTRKP